MRNTLSRIMGYGLFLLMLFALLGPCLSTGPPATDPQLVRQQLELVRETQNVLHEEIAAAHSPSRWPMILFMVSILAPLGAGIWLLFRAEKSAVTHDQLIRAMVRAGFEESVVSMYLLDTKTQPKLGGPGSGEDLRQLPPVRRQ